MSTMNYNYNNINSNNNNKFYNMNSQNYYNYNQGNSSIYNNYSHLQNNTSNINYQDNNILYLNQINSNIQNNNFNQNDISSTINMKSLSSNDDNDLSNKNIILSSNYNNNLTYNHSNNNISMISNNHNNNPDDNYDSKITEVTKKIPLIRFYVFVKKLKAKCVFSILYQISYILSLLDINKRINFINSMPFKLPNFLQKIFLINLPIKVIEAILPSYKNYHIPTTQEIIAPFLELIINLSSIPVGIQSKSNRNDYRSYEVTTYHNKDEKSNNSMSPLFLPQSELPCHNSPENTHIIQTPSVFLNDNTNINEEMKNHLDALKIDENMNKININYESSHENINNSYNYNIKHQRTNNSSFNEIKNDNVRNEQFENNVPLKLTIPKKENSNDNSESPYNFLANNMKLQSNLTLFPLSPYITLNNSDFDTSIESISNHSPNNQNVDTSNNNSNVKINKSPITESSQNFSTAINVTSSPAATLSTVAASIAALKSSSSSSKYNETSFSRNEKRNLSMIKGSNIVKNIVKNFEEINTFYKNSLLKAAENINNTKSAKRSSSKKSSNSDNINDDNNDSINNNDSDNDIESESILEEEICQEPLNDIELINNDNIDEILSLCDNNDNNSNSDKNENILSSKDKLFNSELKYDITEPPTFLKESDLATIRESTAILNSYYYDPNININENEGMTEIIKDFSLEENGEDSESSNSEVSNAIFNSLINVEDLDITRLTILLIENFVKLSDTEKEEFLNSEYFDLIKNHVMNIQNDEEIEFRNVFKDPKMLNEFESHIEALQQCVKERDDIINYYYQEIVNERIQNEKLLIFCENEQLEREETNKIISGLSKKIEMEEDYIKKLEVRCEMLIEKIKKYQSC
eukprot:jgi/Orpsp1_1/1190638/evm.model.d7180000080283.1